MEELLEQGVYDMKELADGGWVTALRYEDEVISDLKKRTGGKDDKVCAVTPWAFCTGCPFVHCLFQNGNHNHISVNAVKPRPRHQVRLCQFAIQRLFW